VQLPDVNPARAYLSLSEIEPPITKPIRSETIKPLSERAREQLNAARQMTEEQRYTEASIRLERALRYDPDHSEIHRAMAILDWEAGNLQRAEAHASRAIDRNPDDIVVHYVLGRCQAAAGSNDAAIASYRTALLCSNPQEHADYAILCHYYLAEVLAEEGYLEAALEQYNAFESKETQRDQTDARGELARILQGQGGSTAQASSRILERLGRFAEAAGVLAPTVADSPADTGLGVRYAGLLMRAGKLAEALEAVRAIQSDDDRVLRLLSEIHDRLGHGERFVDDLRARLAMRRDQPRLVLSLADALVRFKRTAEAREELQAYLRHDPEADEVRGRLVDVLTATSAWTEALQTAAEWATREPSRLALIEAQITSLSSKEEATAELVETSAGPGESYASVYLRGVLAVAARRFDLAERLLRASLARDAAFAPTRAALARLYLRQYRYDEAIETAKRAKEDLAEDARLERVLGEVYERLDRVEQAELHFKAATQLDRTDTEAMYLLARLHNRSGRGLQAVRQLRALLKDDPLHERAREMLALAYLQDGQYEAAVAEFEELKRLAVSLNTQARCSALLGQLNKPDPETFRKTLLAAMEQNGADARTWLVVAESYDRFEEAFDARSAYENAVQADPEYEDAALGLVEVQKRCLDFEEAARLMETLLPRRPNRHEWRIELINLYWTIQDYDTALSIARREGGRSDIDEPTRTRYRLAILGTHQLAGRAEETLNLLQEWTKAEPENERWSVMLAGEYIRRDRAVEALPMYLAAFEADSEDRAAMYDLVDALLATGQSGRASQYALDWLNEDPDNDRAVALLANVLSRADRIDDSIELLRNRLLRTLHREDLQDILIGYLLVADRHTECADFVKALMDEVLLAMQSSSERAGPRPTGRLRDEEIARRPDEPFSIPDLQERVVELRLHLVRALIAGEEFREAEDELTAWIEASRDAQEQAEYLNRLAVCQQLRADDRRANETLEQLLALVPGDPGLNNNVAYGWIDRGVRLAEAESLIRYAVWRAPRQPAYLDTFGWLLYKKGSFDQAKKWVSRANNAMPRPDPVVLDHLGDICYRLSRTEEAVEHWAAAVTAVGERTDEELVAEDIRRVRDGTQQKIDDVKAGRTPSVAPLATVEP